MPGDWTRPEVEAIVADYLEMLALELQGIAYSKAAHERQVSDKLENRRHGSISRKYQNISAVMIEQGCPYVDGYKPLDRYQNLVIEVVSEQVVRDDKLLALLKHDAETLVPAREVTYSKDDLLAALEAAPAPVRKTPYLDRSSEQRCTPPRLNYLALEASNAGQGKAGEQWTMAYERARLTDAGSEQLATRVEWVAHTVGDHLGFDIHSFEVNGADRLIEVKTTKHGKDTPFYVSRNEVRVSRHYDEAYHLYRLFTFPKAPQLYTVVGALDRCCALDPTEYEARVG